MEIIALACISALSVYIILILTRVNSFLANVERDVHDITVRALPVFSNLEAITSRIRSITEGLEDEVEMVKRSIRSLRAIVDGVIDFEQRVQQKIEEPVMDTVSTVAGFYKGIKTFLRVFRS